MLRSISAMESSARPPRRRPPGIPLGRVAGAPVYLSVSWFLLAFVVTVSYADLARSTRPGISEAAAYAVGFGFLTCLFLSVFLHELGHALMSRRHGIGVRAITLEMLGGYTEMTREAPTPRVEALVSLAGPAVSLLLGGVAAAAVPLLPAGSIPRELAFQLAVSNLVVAAFNVLPGLPLDGGRALRAAVWAGTSDPHLATRLAGWCGRVVAAGALVAAVACYQYRLITVTGLLFIAVVVAVLWVGAGHGVRAGRLGSRYRLLHVGRLALAAVPVPADTPLSEALRRATLEGAAGIIVTDSTGRPRGLVDDHAAAAVPQHRRPWVNVDSVAKTVTSQQVLAADLHGEDVVDAVQAHPASNYLVVTAGEPPRILRASDIADVLLGKRRTTPTADPSPQPTLQGDTAK